MSKSHQSSSSKPMGLAGQSLADRQATMARALRDNLRKRKAQQRARADRASQAGEPVAARGTQPDPAALAQGTSFVDDDR